MPLFNVNTNVAPLPITPVTTTPNQIIDTASYFSDTTTTGTTILGYLDGSPQAVNYYSQYLGKDDLVINANDITDPTIKQYLKIVDLEIRVTQALAADTSNSSGTSIVTGEANMYPVVTPTVGDILTIEVEAGVFGLFQVISITRASLYKESAWSITYSQIGYITLNDIETNYDAYVVETVIFNAKNLGIKNNKLLYTKSEFLQLTSKQEIIKDLIENYYNIFYSFNNGTLIAPFEVSSNWSTYDPYIVKFWNTIVSQDLRGDKEVPIEYDITSSMINQNYNTILDAIAKQSISIYNSCIKATTLVSVGAFDVPYSRHTVMVSSLSTIVYPYVNMHQADTTYGTNNSYNTYIFSSNFYQNLSPMSLLEIQVIKLLNKKPILYNDLVPILQNLNSLDIGSQFYQTPILITLFLVCR